MSRLIPIATALAALAAAGLAPPAARPREPGRAAAVRRRAARGADRGRPSSTGGPRASSSARPRRSRSPTAPEIVAEREQDSPGMRPQRLHARGATAGRSATSTPVPRSPQAVVDDRTGEVIEAWRDHQVEVKLARGYEDAVAGNVSEAWIWIPLCLLFFAAVLRPAAPLPAAAPRPARPARLQRLAVLLQQGRDRRLGPARLSGARLPVRADADRRVPAAPPARAADPADPGPLAGLRRGRPRRCSGSASTWSTRR